MIRHKLAKVFKHISKVAKILANQVTLDAVQLSFSRVRSFPNGTLQCSCKNIILTFVQRLPFVAYFMNNLNYNHGGLL